MGPRAALLVLAMSSAGAFASPAHAQGHHVVRHGADADWDHWAGRSTEFLVSRLGAADLVAGERWTFHDVIVGDEHTGPYTVWELIVRVHDGRIVRVDARRTAGIGCILEE